MRPAGYASDPLHCRIRADRERREYSRSYHSDPREDGRVPQRPCLDPSGSCRYVDCRLKSIGDFLPSSNAIRATRRRRRRRPLLRSTSATIRSTTATATTETTAMRQSVVVMITSSVSRASRRRPITGSSGSFLTLAWKITLARLKRAQGPFDSDRRKTGGETDWRANQRKSARNETGQEKKRWNKKQAIAPAKRQTFRQAGRQAGRQTSSHAHFFNDSSHSPAVISMPSDF